MAELLTDECSQLHRRGLECAAYCWVADNQRTTKLEWKMDTNTLIIIVLVVLLLGGGGFFYRRRS